MRNPWRPIHPASTLPILWPPPDLAPILFSSTPPVDLLDVNAVLLPVAHQQPHLFEIRLQEALDPDLSATGGPALTLRTLILQERIVPASFGLPPFPLIAGHSRELARHLSDLRLTRLSTIGLQVRLQAQGRQKTLGTQGQTIINNRLDSKIFFPVLSN